jgi:hypothetical protein
MNFGIVYSGFPAVLEGYIDANWIFIQKRQNLLVIMYSHLVVVQLLGDHPNK